MIGFVFVLGLSKITTKPLPDAYSSPKKEPKAAAVVVEQAAPQTPPRTTPAGDNLGIVNTPSGRRSARIASKTPSRRKED